MSPKRSLIPLTLAAAGTLVLGACSSTGTARTAERPSEHAPQANRGLMVQADAVAKHFVTQADDPAFAAVPND